MNHRTLILLWAVWLSAFSCGDATEQVAVPAEILVIDSDTGRGVPLVELETVNAVRFVTDNAGRVAIHESDWLGREVFFTVRSHGYEVAKDGFGFAGVKVTPRVGQPATIKVSRRMLAERLCRLTGEGRYRDSQQIGHAVPNELAEWNGRVAGQDSIQAVVYRGQVHAFWGDTNRLEYPLGLFRTAGAVFPVPDANADFSGGLPYRYFVDPKTGFARNMMPLPERPEGVIWIFGVCVVPDDQGKERLVGHYSRRKGLADELEHGLALFDDERHVFEPLKVLPLEEKWRHPNTNPLLMRENGEDWLYFGSPNPNVRVRAKLSSLVDPTAYEALTCAASETPTLDTAGKPVWRWQTELPPVDSKTEQRLVREGKLKPEHCRFFPANSAKPAERILLHNGSVRWNAHRRRWVLLAGQLGGDSSFLGEVWYAEAEHPSGPFPLATKVLTHDKQTFYNVVHHDFLDRDGGRVIHFEGTYTHEFSGNPDKTPRYNYNQILYRLNVDAPGLRAPR
jgi:hypothetical protein